MKYKVIVFDVDNTIAGSKCPLEPRMGELLSELSKRVPIAATTGTSLARFEEMVFPYLPSDMPLQNFYLMPTSGAAFYTHDGTAWQTMYQELLTEEEMQAAEDALMHSLERTGVEVPAEPIGPLIERRYDTMVNFAGLGQKAPISAKEAWDPDRKKRAAMAEVIAPLLPWAVVRPAGTTSIDITRKGIDKDFGIRKLSAHLNIPAEQMLYIGDALFPGGNDEIVKTTGIATRLVKNPSHTMEVIEELLNDFSLDADIV